MVRWPCVTPLRSWFFSRKRVFGACNRYRKGLFVMMKTGVRDDDNRGRSSTAIICGKPLNAEMDDVLLG